MTEEQIQYFERFAESFIKNARNKYTRGAIEHDGDLKDMPTEQLLNEIIWENIDQAIYLHALKERLYGQ